MPGVMTRRTNHFEARPAGTLLLVDGVPAFGSMRPGNAQRIMGPMKLLPFIVTASGLGPRALRAELQARNISVQVTPTCLHELVRDAEIAARDSRGPQGYLNQLREQIALRADFVKTWTETDEPVDTTSFRNLVAIARRNSLPRAWKLSEPVATEARQPTPIYQHWASAA